MFGEHRKKIIKLNRKALSIAQIAFNIVVNVVVVRQISLVIKFIHSQVNMRVCVYICAAFLIVNIYVCLLKLYMLVSRFKRIVFKVLGMINVKRVQKVEKGIVS